MGAEEKSFVANGSDRTRNINRCQAIAGVEGPIANGGEFAVKDDGAYPIREAMRNDFDIKSIRVKA